MLPSWGKLRVGIEFEDFERVLRLLKSVFFV